LRTVGDECVAVVESPDRTRVEVEPDTTVRFPDGGPRVVLMHGQLLAEVPDRTGEPMVVRAPGADILNRGAAFLVASAGGDSVRVEP
jgi:ferric-dicitrate binding protein FerR (iron transport regulator)